MTRASSSRPQGALLGPSHSGSHISTEKPQQDLRSPSPIGRLSWKFGARGPPAHYLGLGKSPLACSVCALTYSQALRLLGWWCFVLIKGVLVPSRDNCSFFPTSPAQAAAVATTPSCKGWEKGRHWGRRVPGPPVSPLCAGQPSAPGLEAALGGRAALQAWGSLSPPPAAPGLSRVFAWRGSAGACPGQGRR